MCLRYPESWLLWLWQTLLWMQHLQSTDGHIAELQYSRLAGRSVGIHCLWHLCYHSSCHGIIWLDIQPLFNVQLMMRSNLMQEQIPYGDICLINHTNIEYQKNKWYDDSWDKFIFVYPPHDCQELHILINPSILLPPWGRIRIDYFAHGSLFYGKVFVLVFKFVQFLWTCWNFTLNFLMALDI